MCGIVSIISKDWNTPINFNAEKIFKQMLFADALRGTDGTGFFWYEAKTKETFFEKKPLPSWHAISGSTNLNKLAQNASFVVGHNRKATVGTHTEENTHPFIEGKICLIHNGTLDSTYELEKELGKTEVDSQLIAKLLDKKKPKQALEQIKGAFALVWYNTDEQKLYFARNKERPLWLVESEQYYFVVSEPGLAEWITERNGLLTTKRTELDVGKIYSLGVNKLDKLQLHVVTFTPAQAIVWSKQDYHEHEYQAPPPQQQVLPYQNPIKQEGNPFILGPNTQTRTHLEKWYRKNDTISFKVTNSYSYNGTSIVKGVTLDKPVFTVELSNLGDIKTPVKIGDILHAYLHKIQFSFSDWRLICIEPEIDRGFSYQTDDGTILTDRVVRQLDKKCCVSCKTPASNDMESSMIWYDEKKQEYEFLCDACAWTTDYERQIKYATA